MSRLRNVGMLAAGTAAAHVISLVAAPLLTRLYTPAEFGLLGVFTSIAAVAAVAVSLRLELAVPVPSDEEESASVVTAGLLVVAAMSLVAAVLVTTLSGAVARLFGEPQLGPLLSYLPLYLAGAGVFNMLNFWFAREGRFLPVAVVNTTRALGVAAVQVVLGLTRSGAGGLVIGQTVGPVVQAAGLLASSGRGDRRLRLKRLTGAELGTVLRRFREYILYGTPQALVNSLNQSLPAVVLTLAFDASVAGYYLLAHRLVAAPIGLLGRSVRQVIYPQLARDYERGVVFGTAARATARMAAIAVPVAGAMFVAGPTLFTALLGAEWRVAGEYARFLAVWLAVGFVNIPAVCLVPLLGMQRWHATYEVIYLGARLAALLYGARAGDPLVGIVWFAAVGVAFNAVLTVVPLLRVRSATVRRVSEPVDASR